ncbi:MAG: hypothetical protein P9M12_00400 [Candidatus Aceula lacicola]|nr:hypothetical protein [Candidatus Aceula lacicola]
MKKKTVFRIVSVIALCLVVTFCYAQKPKEFYAIVFGVTVNREGKLIKLQISKIIDIISGSKENVNIDIPEDYLKNVTEKIKGTVYEPSLENGEPVEFFTYFYFDPTRPALVIDSLEMIK